MTSHLLHRINSASILQRRQITSTCTQRHGSSIKIYFKVTFKVEGGSSNEARITAPMTNRVHSVCNASPRFLCRVTFAEPNSDDSPHCNTPLIKPCLRLPPSSQSSSIDIELLGFGKSEESVVGCESCP